LALASLNAITYVFWWHKPLGVQVPIRIYFETETVENVDVEVEDADAKPATVETLLTHTPRWRVQPMGYVRLWIIRM